MESRIKFASEKGKFSFESLENSDKRLYKFLVRAFEDLEKNVFCGIRIPSKVVPKEYLRKNGIHNVWKYNLPGAWRLLYSVESNGIVVLSIILEWVDHKTYERIFRY